MIRRGHLEDFDILFKWINDEDVIRFSRYKKEMDLEEFNSWFDSKLDNLFVIEEDLVPLGQVSFEVSGNGDEAIISYSVDRDERGRGYGKALIHYIVNFIKENRDDIKIVSAFISSDNEISIKIFENEGFKREVEEDDYLKVTLSIR
ncbi:GNAT family N-acetyltransferase [Clostridium sardiniense]|uniref:GNAT family N-acetyltransferase n=1 Tax=Clostridium sardiniense TaxID=29369 RepID=A0ABS7KUT5_CLOSR|nr:GNAT family N-acetyltransferase [Clostridium sardiniense]MBY0754338.1 GNAT family N-acetyltransferase [Clostridium sardiniense]MDQ0461070.1 RimJ/RimL family protein N-acetyltransferase [Clostridium sardiniense]